MISLRLGSANVVLRAIVFASSCMACRSPGYAGSPYHQSVIPYGSPYHVIAPRTVPGNQLHRTSHLPFYRTKRHTARMPHRCSPTLDAHAGRAVGIHDGERDHVDVSDHRGVIERYSGEYGRGQSQLPPVSFGTSANAGCLDVISRFLMLFALLAHR
jgi:hypothetical protein